MSPELEDAGDIVALTADVVAAYVSNNSVATGDLPKLIGDIHAALRGLGAPAVEPEVKLEPAIAVKKSVTADFIVCLEDGKKFKSLKRHLRTRYGLSPDEYRQKWGLPADYPMVAPNYAASRSALAKTMGLGRLRRGAEPEPVVVAEPAPVAKAKRTPRKAAEPAPVEVEAPPAKKPRKTKAAAKV
ncbi:MAG TPA: MucR family transcriptional regulator [Xanthobacteraceae bacterium]|nr:MucR family transcriptional regulator [Xanthobacteraceae bacterium]